MPQIVGLANFPPEIDAKSALEAMIGISGERTIRHLYTDKNVITAMVSDIVWPRGEMYFESADKNFAGLFSGELYNTADDLKFLEAKGYKFVDRTDAEIALAAFLYREQGGLSVLNGNFCIVVHNRGENTLYFITDRYGQQRFYYAKAGNMFAFAGKVKCFLKLPGFNPRINLTAVVSLLKFGCILGEEAMLKGTYFFPAASICTLKDGNLDQQEYWDYPRTLEKGQLLDEKQAVEELSYLLRKAMRKLNKGDYRKGIQLTGGMDSRALISAADPDIRDFLIITEGIPGCYDLRYSAQIAKIYNLPHHIIELDSTEISKYARDTVWEIEGEGPIAYSDHYLIGLKTKGLIDTIYTGFYNIQSGRWVKDKETLKISNKSDLTHYLHSSPHFGPEEELFNSVSGDLLKEANQKHREIESEIVHFTGDLVNDILRYIMIFFYRRSMISRKIVQDWYSNRYPFVENELLEAYFTRVPPELKIGERIYRKIILKNGPELASVPAGTLNITLDATSFTVFRANVEMWFLMKLNSLKNEFTSSKKPLSKYIQYTDYAYKLRVDKKYQDLMRDLLFSNRSQKRGLFHQDQLKIMFNRHLSTRYSYHSILELVATVELFQRLFIEGEGV